MRAGTMVVVAVLVAGACGTREAPVEAPAAMAGLVTTLEVEASESTARLVLHVTNTTDEVVELEFPSAQRYDFSVERTDGTQLWQWSAARSFAQALGTERLEPGATVRYTADWPTEGRTGEFVARAEVTASNVTLRQAARFRVEQ